MVVNDKRLVSIYNICIHAYMTYLFLIFSVFPGYSVCLQVFFFFFKLLQISKTFSNASPGSMHNTGFLGLVHWDDPEGWYGEGGRRVFRMGNTSIPVADSC